MKTVGKISAVCAALLCLALASCKNAVTPDGGLINGGHWEEGITKQKFWNLWAPFAGIQCWGMGEGESWGQEPVIDLNAGTFTASKDAGAMFPVFGLFDDNGNNISGASYDVSSVAQVEFDYYGSGAANVEFAVFGNDSYKDKLEVTTTTQHKTVEVSDTSTTNLIWFNCAPNEKGYVLHIENLSFYDANGKQLKKIPVVYE